MTGRRALLALWPLHLALPHFAAQRLLGLRIEGEEARGEAPLLGEERIDQIVGAGDRRWLAVPKIAADGTDALTCLLDRGLLERVTSN